MALGSSPHANPVRTRPATRPFILRPFAAEQPPYQPPRVSQSSIIGRRSQPQKGSSSIGGRQERACGLFDDAAGTTDRMPTLRRLRRAVRSLKGAIKVVSRYRYRLGAFGPRGRPLNFYFQGTAAPHRLRNVVSDVGLRTFGPKCPCGYPSGTPKWNATSLGIWNIA